MQKKRTEVSALPTRRAFARRLKAHRVAAGYETATEFASELGIALGTYTRWERAETEPDLTMLGKIISTLSITANDLLMPQKPKTQRRPPSSD
jgi:transcriptional regulator with XRE-family HTH domain